MQTSVLSAASCFQPLFEVLEMSRIHLAIHGAAGRMGQRLIALAAADTQFGLVAALEAAGHPRIGEDAGAIAGAGPLDVPLSSESSAAVDVMIDFSVPVGTERATQLCLASRTPLVVATTGLSAAQQDALRAAAQQIPLLWSPSMSLAVNLTMKLGRGGGPGTGGSSRAAPTWRSSNGIIASRKTLPAARH